MFEFNRNGIHVVKYRILWFCLSALLLIPGIVAMIYSMIHYPTHSPVKVGIDYTGGTILQYGTTQEVANSESGIIQDELSKDGTVKQVGTWQKTVTVVENNPEMQKLYENLSQKA